MRVRSLAILVLLSMLPACAKEQKCADSRKHAQEAWRAIETAARAGTGREQMAEFKRLQEQAERMTGKKKPPLDPGPPLASEDDKRLLTAITTALGRGDLAGAERDGRTLHERLRGTELRGLADAAMEATTAAAGACK